MQRLSKSDLSRMVGQNYNLDYYQKKIQAARLKEQTYHTAEYDVFLSHSYGDRETILRLNYYMEEHLGLSVFVDWIENPDLNRDHVTAETAEAIRDVMKRCASLVYAVSENSASSKWMPWELGFSDGQHGKVAVLPISDPTTTSQAYANQEFVGVYPIVEVEDQPGGQKQLIVRSQQDRNKNANLKEWRRTGVLTKSVTRYGSTS